MAKLDDLLAETSRTFALTIPLLPSPIREQATIAYLLLRIADTLEDADAWASTRRIDELRKFDALLRASDPRGVEAFAARMARDWPTGHAGYRRLLAEAPAVFAAFESLEPRAREVIRGHVRRTVEGMAAMLARADGGIELRSLEEVRGYCYFVAGLVGELLTELFLIAVPQLERASAPLRERAREFGEALQLTNIVKDEADDARDGRRFIPAGVRRADLIALARRDMERAFEYVRALFDAGAPKAVWAFTALPLRLAAGTLAAVEQRGPAAKVPRSAVARVLAELAAATTPAAFLR